ncbi:hypothetical protein D3C72_1227660 [compost metagenome]
MKLAKDGVVQQSSYKVEQGLVFNQHPYAPKEQVSPGEEITIFVSSGYPPEAIKYTYNVPVAPKTEGKNSKIRLVYTDARGENREAGVKTIKTAQTIPVDLVLAPTKDGAILVYQDGKYLDTLPVSYIDAKQGTVPVPSTPIGQQPADTTPPDQPQQDPNNTGDNSSGDSASINGEYGGATERYASDPSYAKQVKEAQKEAQKAEKKKKKDQE